MSYGRMKEEEQRLRQEIQDLLTRATKADAAEDKRYGRDPRGDELPAELARREDRLKTIEAARKRLEARQREIDEKAGREPGDPDRSGKPGKPFKRAFGEPEAKAQENFTDPDSRIMKRGSSGFEQCDNAQIAVEETTRIIVAASVTQNATDVRELEPLIDQIEQNTGELPEKGLADAGYRSESNLTGLEARGIDGFVAFGREKSGQVKEPDAGKEATTRMFSKMKTRRGQKNDRKRKYSSVITSKAAIHDRLITGHTGPSGTSFPGEWISSPLPGAARRSSPSSASSKGRISRRERDGGAGRAWP